MTDLQTVFAHLRSRLATDAITDDDWRVLADALTQAEHPDAEVVRLETAVRSGELRGSVLVAARSRLLEIAKTTGYRSTQSATYDHGFLVAVDPAYVDGRPAKIDAAVSIVDRLRPRFEGAPLLTRLLLGLARPTDQHLEQLAAWPTMTQVQALQISVDRMTDVGFRALIDSPHLALHTLWVNGPGVRHQFGLETFRALGQVDWPLRHLSLAPMLDDADVRALVSGRPPIEWLHLRRYPAGWQAIGDLVEALPALTALNVELAEAPGETYCGPVGTSARLELPLRRSFLPHLRQLGQQPWLRVVRKLVVPQAPPSDGVAGLVSSPFLSGLVEARIWHALSPEMVDDLFEHAPNLTALYLQPGPSGDEGARALARHLSRLDTLLLQSSRLGQVGFATLWRTAGDLSRLRDVSVGHDELSGGPIRELAARDDLRPQRLRIDQGGLDDDDARVLAGSPVLSLVRELDLHDNAIGVAGLRALVASPHLSCLEVVNLRNNPLGAEAIPIVVDPTTWPRLQTFAVGPRPPSLVDAAYARFA